MSLHPTNNLTVKGGTLSILDGHNTPYMDCKEIKVIRRCTFIVKPGTDTIVYSFELDNFTDSIWRDHFKTICSDPAVTFAGNQMVFQCKSEELESTYKSVKAAIDKTNGDYNRDRDVLIKQVAVIDQQRASEEKLAQDKATALKRQFDSLQL